MPTMRNYRVIVSNDATDDLDGMVRYIASLYRVEILGKLASLSYTADMYRYSQFATARRIHPKAKTLFIMNHKWTVVFHIDGNFVMIDRFIPSKLMVD